MLRRFYPTKRTYWLLGLIGLLSSVGTYAQETNPTLATTPRRWQVVTLREPQKTAVLADSEAEKRDLPMLETSIPLANSIEPAPVPIPESKSIETTSIAVRALPSEPAPLEQKTFSERRWRSPNRSQSDTRLAETPVLPEQSAIATPAVSVYLPATALRSETGGDSDESAAPEPVLTDTPSESGSVRVSSLPYFYRAFNEKPMQLPLQNPHIVVDKRRRLLQVFDGSTEVRRYGVGLGRDPHLPKLRQGDGRTPEGRYRIAGKSTQSKFYKNMAINYPNIKDAERAWSQRLISGAEFDRITNQLANGQMPTSRTKLGGQIFIHGKGELNGDWTEGCIALRNDDLDELFSIIPVGTPVFIYW